MLVCLFMLLDIQLITNDQDWWSLHDTSISSRWVIEEQPLQDRRRIGFKGLELASLGFWGLGAWGLAGFSLALHKTRNPHTENHRDP